MIRVQTAPVAAMRRSAESMGRAELVRFAATGRPHERIGRIGRVQVQPSQVHAGQVVVRVASTHVGHFDEFVDGEYVDLVVLSRTVYPLTGWNVKRISS